MTLLEEKHCDVLMTNGLSYVELSKECAKITLQHCIDVLRELRDSLKKNEGFTISLYAQHKIDAINQQLSDLNKRSNIADGGDFKALLLHHCTKFNSSTNAQLWHVCPTIGNILLAAVKFKVCSTY